MSAPLKQIMLRHAEDDFIALLTANGMLSADAEVFSVTVDGERTHFGALASHRTYIVWAKVEDDAHIDRVDKAISAALDKPTVREDLAR